MGPPDFATGEEKHSAGLDRIDRFRRVSCRSLSFPSPGRYPSIPVASTISWPHRLSDHFFEPVGDFGGEVGLDLVNIGELGKGPAAVRLELVHAGYPIGGSFMSPPA